MAMNMLEQLLGGGQQRQQYEDFTRRYDEGAPWDGISEQEAMDRYQQVAPQLIRGCTSSRLRKPSRG